MGGALVMAHPVPPEYAWGDRLALAEWIERKKERRGRSFPLKNCLSNSTGNGNIDRAWARPRPWLAMTSASGAAVGETGRKRNGSIIPEHCGREYHFQPITWLQHRVTNSQVAVAAYEDKNCKLWCVGMVACTRPCAQREAASRETLQTITPFLYASSCLNKILNNFALFMWLKVIKYFVCPWQQHAMLCFIQHNVKME